MSDPGDDLSAVSRAYREAAPWLSVTWQFAGTAMLGVAVGYGWDVWRGSKPWGLMVGGLVGAGLGMFAFIRGALKLSEKKKP